MFRSAILQNMKITRFFRCTVHLLSRISSEKNKNLNPKYIKFAGRGDYIPVADNSTAEGRAQNRRVEIKIYNSFNSNVKENN